MTDSVNNPDVLFSNRDLHLLWLPPICHSPSLHTLPSGLLSWHWRCDLTFLSWLNRLARNAGSKLPPELVEKVAFIRSYVCLTNGIDDDNWREKWPAADLELPNDFPADTVTLFDVHVGPWWPGIEGIAVKVGYANPLRTEFFAPDQFKDFLKQQAYEAKKRQKRAATVSQPKPESENPAF